MTLHMILYWCGQGAAEGLIVMKLALSTDTPLYQITLLASGGYFFPYAGTTAMLDDFFASLEQHTPSAPDNEPDPHGYEHEILSLYRRYQAGDQKVKFWKQPFIKPVKVFQLTEPVEISPYAASFTTEQNERILLTGARMRYRLVYGRCARKYRRYAWMEVEDGYSRSEELEELEESAVPLDELFLLHTSMFAPENKVMASRLLFKEREFASQLAMETDMAAPVPVNFDSFFHELFGDEEPDL